MPKPLVTGTWTEKIGQKEENSIENCGVDELKNMNIMKYRILILLSLMLSLAGKAQTNEIQLDEDGIMRVGAPVTIVTIGNSITAGYSNPSAYWAWPAQMERMLGPEYQVKNYAVSGTTMNIHINSSYRNTGNYPKAKAANPDILFIAHGTNDAVPGRWSQWGELFCDDYKSMVASFRDGGRNPIIYSIMSPPVFGSNRVEQNKNIEQQVLPRVKQVATEVGAGIIDFNTPFVGRNDCFPDNVHPSDPTAKRMAEIVKSAMLPQQKLSAQAKVKKGTVISPTMVVVEPGSSATLTPSAPTKGSWLWSGPDGFTSTKRVLKLKNITSGGVYNVCFQDGAGNRSVLNFLVSVRGQKAGTITPNVLVADNGWQETATVTVRPGQDIKFGPSCSAGNDGGTWSWRGPNGFFAYGREVVISVMTATKAGRYGVTFTDAQGRQTSAVFDVKVEGELYCPKLVCHGHNEDGWRQTDSIAVKPGTPVTFAPHPTNGKWEWTGPNGFHSNERHNQIFDFNEKMEGKYIGTYTNEAGCRQQLVVTLVLAKEEKNKK